MADFSHKKIYPNKTLGERLKSYRKRKRLTLEKAEEETKVRLKYLEALENGDYNKLPADVYTIGFLAKYAEFLEAPHDEIISAYKREREFPGVIKLSPSSHIKESRVWLTPRLMVVAVVILFFLGLVGYIFYSVENFTSAPNLEISAPVAESIIRQDNIEVIGKTDEGATLSINEQTVFIDNRGNFKETVKLQSGLNNIEEKSTNRLKKQTIKVIKILAEY